MERHYSITFLIIEIVSGSITGRSVPANNMFAAGKSKEHLHISMRLEAGTDHCYPSKPASDENFMKKINGF